MELANPRKPEREPEKRNISKQILFQRYNSSNKLISDRPLAFIYEGDFSKIKSIRNYSFHTKTKSTTLGIRNDLKVFGFSFDVFLKFLTVDKFNPDLINEEIKSILNSEREDAPLSREAEIDILADFFEM